MAPTLLQQGKLSPVAKSNYKESQKALDKYDRAIDYIFDKLRLLAKSKERVLVLQSKTGSGKSTALMAYLYQQHESIFPESRGKYLVVTQPKVLTTKTIPEDIVSKPFYSFMEMGRNIGFVTGPLKNPSQRGGLLYSTVGVLSMQMTLQDDAYIRDRYGFIVIDEAHDQSQEMAVLLYMLKKFLERNAGRQDCPIVILMSATLDLYQFGDYFRTKNLIKVEGSTFPIQDEFLPGGVEDYLAKAAEMTMAIHRENPGDPSDQCDILIFLPGIAQMKKVQKLLEEADTKEELAVFILNSAAINSGAPEVTYATALPLKDVARILKRPNLKRRVSLATDAAETGLTIDTLKYVIDSGWSSKPEYNPIHDINLLITKAINNNSMIQRRGRVGRQFPGIYRPIYSKKTFESVPKKALSPLYTENIDRLLIDIFAYQAVKYPNKGPEIPETYDPIGTESLIRSIDKMRILGLMDNDSLALTRLGKMCVAMNRLSIETCKVIISSYLFGLALEDIVTVALFMRTNRNDYIIRPFKDVRGYRFTDILEELDIKMKPFYVNLIVADQFIQWWFVVELFKRMLKKYKLSKIPERMEKLGINFANFVSLLAGKRDILETLKRFGFHNIFPPLKLEDFEKDLPNVVARFKGCFYEGLKLNYAVWNEKRRKYLTRTGIELEVRWIDLAKGIEPKTFVYDSILIKSVPRLDQYYYAPTINQYSILDGYLAICAECESPP